MTDLLVLVCKTCRWRPPADLSMGVVRAHVESEHPEQVTSDGDLDVQMEMVVICPRCDIEVPLFRSIDKGATVDLEYVCGQCHRGYGIQQNKEAS